MSAQDFMAMTGCDETAATMYLEMAGGNLEIAMGIYFDGGAQGGGGGMAAPPPPAADDDEYGAATRVLLGSDAAPASWLDQPLAARAEGGVFVVDQVANGPCGVLAAAHALATTFGEPDGRVALRRAASAMVAGCASDGRAKLARWTGAVGASQCRGNPEKTRGFSTLEARLSVRLRPDSGAFLETSESSRHEVSRSGHNIRSHRLVQSRN